MSNPTWPGRSPESLGDGLRAPRGHAARGQFAGKAGRAIQGVFRRPEDASSAVNSLLENSVPADEITVYHVGASGSRRRLRVREDAGSLRGALAGAVVGALIGFLIAVLAWFGALGEAWTAVLGSGGALGVLAMMAVTGAVGVPLGVLIGMGYWQGRRSFPQTQPGGSVTVSVETDDLAEVARRVLREAGAAEVTG